MATPVTKRTFKPKHAAIAVLMMVIPLLPVLLLVATGLTGGITMLMLGCFSGLMPALFVGLRKSLVVVLVMGLLNALAAPSSSYIVLAGLVMGVTAMLYGLTSRWGVTAFTSMAAISVAFTMAEPPTIVDGASAGANAVMVGLLAVAGGLWGAGVAAVLGRNLPRRPMVTTLSWPAVWTYTLTMTIVTGLAMAAVVAWGLAHGGAWLILTLFVVVQPDPKATWRRSVERTWGTILGFAIALAIALVVHHPAVIAGLGVLFLVGAVYVKLDSSRSYWEFTTLLTPGIVLVEGSSADVVSLDVERLGFTVIGVVVAVVLVEVYRIAVAALPHDDREHADDREGAK